MNIAVSQEAYENYLNKKDTISNERIRPENETFFDAIMSADMTKTPEGREILNTIKNFN